MAADGETPTNAADDARLEATLLRRVLDLHPTRVTATELVRDLTAAAPADDFAARDGIERAIVELTRAGLLHPVAAGGFVDPTLPAVRSGELVSALG